MNIAFPAIVFFVLTIPGLVYRYHARAKLPVKRAQMIELATRAVIPAVMFHVVFLILVHVAHHHLKTSSPEGVVTILIERHVLPNYEAWYLSLSGKPIDKLVRIDHTQIGCLAGYFIFISLIAWMIGLSMGKRRDNLIEQGKLPRISDPARTRLYSWLEILGSFHFRRAKEPAEFAGRLIQFVSERDNAHYVYSGELNEVLFSDDSDPSHLVLTSVSKCALQNKHVHKWTSVTALEEKFVIKYDNVVAMVVSTIDARAAGELPAAGPGIVVDPDSDRPAGESSDVPTSQAETLTPEDVKDASQQD